MNVKENVMQVVLDAITMIENPESGQVHNLMYDELAESIAERLANNGLLSGVRISLPSDAEIHSMADEVSLRQDTRDRMIHAIGLEQGATWIRNNIREQLGSES